MKRLSHLLFAACTALAVLAAPAAALAQQFKPVAIVSIASLEENLADIGYVTRAAGMEDTGRTVRLLAAGLTAGIAGVLAYARLGSANPNANQDLLINTIAAVVLGGTSLFGGRGGIGNTIVGLFVLGVLNNGLDHIQIDPFFKILIRGLILLAALVINVYAQRLRESAKATG